MFYLFENAIAHRSDIIETISATNYDEDDESVPVVDDVSPNRNDIPNSTLNHSSKSIPVAPADKNKNSLQSTNELEGDVIGQVEQVGWIFFFSRSTGIN